MSWIDENFDDMQAMELQALSNLQNKLSEGKLNNIYNKLQEDYVFLIADIMTKFKNGSRLTDKQKYCVAKYLYENDKEYWLEDSGD